MSGLVVNAQATITSVNSTASNTTLLSENTSRRGVTIHNTDSYTLLLKYGETASASSYSVPIKPDMFWEMPDPVYTGRIDGIWLGDGSGAAIITELR